MDTPTAADRSSTAATPLWTVLGLTALIVALALGHFWRLRSLPYDSDSRFYRAIAEGRIAEVHKPFTNRALYPTLARQLAQATGLSLESSFLAMNLLSLAVLVAAGLWLILGFVRSLSLAVTIVLTPMLLGLAREIYLPDCMHAALLAVFFLVLARGRWWYAMPLLFVMQVTRESTLLLTIFLVFAALYQHRWKVALVAILVTVLGMGVAGRVANLGLPNIHNTNTVVYLAGKIPFNFLTNVCGIRMWTNTHATNNPEAYPNEPLFSVELPTWLPTGSLRKIGIYSFIFENPLFVAELLLTLLGIMPSLVLVVVVWRRWRMVRDDGLSLVALVATMYGLTSFLLGPSLGAALGRLIAYGWPLAWVAAPELLARYFHASDQLLRRLTWLQAIACWTPLVAGEIGLAIIPAGVITLVVALVCHYMAIKALRANRVGLGS